MTTFIALFLIYKSIERYDELQASTKKPAGLLNHAG